MTAPDKLDQRWLTPFLDAWEAARGKGTMAPGRLAKEMAPLLRHYDAEEIVGRMQAYLAAKGEYATPANFRQTFMLWQAPAKSSVVLWKDGWLTEDGDRATRP